MRRIVCIILIFRLFLLAEARAEFTDSLHFIIHHEKVVTESDVNYLEFTVSVYRPNANWNQNYTKLGNADFYFSFNELAFVNENPTILELNPDIDRDGVSPRTSTLSALSRVWWASSNKRIHLKVSYKTISGMSLKNVDIPLKDTLEIAVLRWKMAAGNRDPKLKWDMTASGAMTANNIPIIPTFKGEVDKYPKQEINIDETSPAVVWACQGSDVMLFVNARSYGDNIHYQWQDSRTGGNNDSWRSLDPGAGMHTISPDASHPGYDYFIRHGEAGDTLLIRHAPGTLANLKFRCEISDPTLPSTTTKLTEEIQLKLRDSLLVFLSPASNELTEGMTPVNMCPTGDGTNVRLNIIGTSWAGINNVRDIYVKYTFIPEGQIPQQITDTIRSADGMSDDGSVLYKTLKVKKPGVYYVNSASTSHCYDAPAHSWQGLSVDTLLSNAEAYGRYDTIQVRYSTDPDTALLDKYFVNIGADTNLMTGLSGSFTVTNLYGPDKGAAWIGSVVNRGRDTIYHAQNAGKDSIYYVKDIDGCPQVSMREVEVINNYYLTIKVLLEGPFLSEESGMKSVDFQLFPNDGGESTSPYTNTKFLLNNFEVDMTNNVFKLHDGNLCDWILVVLRDGEGGNYVDSVSALLRHDGILCDTSGNPSLMFKNIKNQPYHVIIYHRNHLVVSSAQGVLLHTSVPQEVLIDFSDPSQVLGGSDALTFKNGNYCIIAGDINGDGFVSVADKNLIALDNGKVQYVYDVDHDSYVARQDQKYPELNKGKNKLVP